MKKLFIFLIVGILIGATGIILLKHSINSPEITIENSTTELVPTNYLKEYNQDTQTVTFTNKDTLETDFITKLNSPIVKEVGIGYQQIATFTIDSRKDYNAILGQFDLINLNTGKKITRKLDAKYLAYEPYEVNDYSCNPSENGTSQDCQVIGTHTEKRVVWKDFNGNVKSNEPITIGLFTRVQQGDNVEWIPTIAGIKVEEWAIWTASLETSIDSWYRLNETTGSTAKTAVGNLDGTYQGSLPTAHDSFSSIVNNSQYFDGSDDVDLYVYHVTGSSSFSWGLWFNATSLQARDLMSQWAASSSTDSKIHLSTLSNGSVSWALSTPNDGDRTIYSVDTYTANTWHFIVGTYNGVTKNMSLYLDGVYQTSELYTSSQNLWTNNGILLGHLRTGHANYFTGEIDEAFVYNRTLSLSEAGTLYNDGFGCTYGLCNTTTTTITTLLSPTNYSNYSLSEINFSANVTSPSGTATVNQTSIYYWNNSLNSLNNDTSLIGWWKLDGDVLDSSAYGNDGTNNGATAGIGQYGGGYDFDGASNYIEMPENTVLNTTNESFTLSAWIKFTQVTNFLKIAEKREGSGDRPGWVFDQRTSGVVALALDNGTTNIIEALNNPISDGNWHLVTATVDRDAGLMSIYIDGELDNTPANISAFGTSSFYADVPFTIGGGLATLYWNGSIDDFRYYNKSLSSSETYELYRQTTPRDTNSTAFTTPQKYDFNLSSIPDGNWYWNMWAGTDSSGTFSQDWGVERYFTVDTILPTISITSPTSFVNYQENGTNLYLNWSITESNLDSCWYDYDNSNSSVTCGDGTTTFTTKTSQNKTITLYANDSSGNLNFSQKTWGYGIYLENYHYNTTAYETSNDSYIVNLTANTSLTNVYMKYRNHTYSLNNLSNNWTYSHDIPLNEVANNSFNWTYTYGGNNISSSTQHQLIKPTFFILCNATYTTPFLNISFKDEADTTYLNASISSSTFTYYLGSGLVNKTYSFSNSSNNYIYTFCTSVNNTFNVIPSISYKQGTAYPQRIWNPTIQTYTNSRTDQILYLLGSANGIYVTFQVINQAEQVLSGVASNITYSGNLISSGTTGADGGITYWINPDNIYTILFYLKPYPLYTATQQFTQTSYTINLGGSSSSTVYDYSKGITYLINPTNSYLDNNTIYNFNFTISSDYWTLERYGFNITNGTGTLIKSVSGTTSGGGTVSTNINTTGNESFIMNYYWTTNSTNTTGIRNWVVVDFSGNSFSIARVLSDFTLYTGTGLFGLDNFGIGLICFFIIIGVTGLLKVKWGVSNTAATLGVIWALVALFDVSFGILPNPLGAVSNFPTIFMGLLFAGIMFKEILT